MTTKVIIVYGVFAKYQRRRFNLERQKILQRIWDIYVADDDISAKHRPSSKPRRKCARCAEILPGPVMSDWHEAATRWVYSARLNFRYHPGTEVDAAWIEWSWIRWAKTEYDRRCKYLSQADSQNSPMLGRCGNPTILKKFILSQIAHIHEILGTRGRIYCYFENFPSDWALFIFKLDRVVYNCTCTEDTAVGRELYLRWATSKPLNHWRFRMTVPVPQPDIGHYRYRLASDNRAVIDLDPDTALQQLCSLDPTDYSIYGDVKELPRYE